MEVQSHVIEACLLKASNIGDSIFEIPFTGFGGSTPCAGPVVDVFEPTSTNTFFKVTGISWCGK
jgi:hypothetical protein